MKITIAQFRDIYDQYGREEISFTRMVEMINEKIEQKGHIVDIMKADEKDGLYRGIEEKSEVLKCLSEVKDWLYSLGPGWNYFGHIDKAKYNLEMAIELLKSRI